MSQRRWIGPALVLACAAAARAQDPPAVPKHENKVSPEAKAAIEKYAQVVYHPVEHGLVSLTGSLVPASGAAVGQARHLEFKPPGHVDVAAQDASDPKAPRVQASRVQLGLPFEVTLSGAPLADSDEYDAGFVTRGDRRVLSVITFRRGALPRTAACELDARGLLVSMSSAVDPAKPSFLLTMRFGWKAIGDEYCIDSIDASFEDSGATKTATTMKYALRYADVGGFHLVSGYDLELSASDGNRATMTVHLADLVLNGTRTEIPGANARGNKVTPEAKTAMDVYAKLVDRPAEHGLVTMSGTLMPTWTKTPRASRFEFRAPNVVSVAMTGDAKQDTPGARAAISFHRFALLAAIDALRIGETPEFDAAFADRDGARVLEVVERSGDTVTATSDFTIDATGLVTTIRRRAGADPAQPTSDLTFHLAWEKAGERYRVRTAELVSAAADKAAASSYAFTYTTIDGFSVMTSYVRTVTEAGGDPTAYTYRVEDLVVNGKKTDIPKPADPPPPPGGGK